MQASPARFVHRFLRPSQAGIVEREILIDVGRRPQPALVFRPDAPGVGRPGWILLHGMTVPGRHHAGVFRFGRAFAAAGAVVICPEIPEWTRLQVDPTPVHSTLVAAAQTLRDDPSVDGGRLGTMAFSIAVPATLAAVARDPLPEQISAVTGFGASCDMRRTVRCMLTGEHEWNGVRYRLAPDPYGRWIVGANVLEDIEGNLLGATREDRASIVDGLERLATTAGRNGAYSDAPVYDTLKLQIRERLRSSAQPLWDLFAPPAGKLPSDLEAARTLADTLATTALRRYPELDARPSLSGVRANVHLVHGYGDQLVPFSETLRLAAAFPITRRVKTTITRLFGHARRELQGSGHRLPATAYPGEAVRFLRTLRDVVLSV